MYDVSIIGSGVVGANIARELSKYDLKVCLIEKMDDVTQGASKANSGIVHGGFAEKAGSLKAKYCVEGKKLYEQLENELHFGYMKFNSLVLGFTEEDEEKIKDLYENGIKNGVQGLEIINATKVKELEPNVNSEVRCALYCTSSGITSPYEFTIALVENAIENGVELKLETEVTAIEKQENYFDIHTNQGIIQSSFVINAAGVFSDKISQMVGMEDFHIIPRRGQYVLLDKEQGKLANNVIFQIPTKAGKGILVTRTYHGNLMIGPNAEEIGEREDVGTNAEILKYIVETARRSIPNFDMNKVLTSFSGVRATSSGGDFIIEETKVKGFINVAGIESPGLTSSPAIAKKVVDILKEANLKLIENENFNPYRKAIIKIKDSNFKGKPNGASPEENIVCVCEKVTEAEIVDALRRGINIRSIDAIKRRTRAGMGKCQGAYCGAKVRDIIARELHIPVDKVVQRGAGSSILQDRAKRFFYKDEK